jgi:hypothetical protein
MIISNLPILILCGLILLVYLIFVFQHLLLVLLILDLIILILILLLLENLIFTELYGYSLIMLCIAAADTAVGLGLFITFYKLTGAVVI